MSNETRLKRALQDWWKRAEQERWKYGKLGRRNADATVTITVAERTDFVYVTLDTGTLTQALNKGSGAVPLRALLPVQLRDVNGVLLVDGENLSMLEDDTNAPGTVYSVNGATGDVVLDSDDIAEGAANFYYPAADETKLAGIEALADVTDVVNIGSSIHGATEKTTPVDADTVPLIDSAASNVLKKVTWANIEATLKTYFDTLYELAGAIATHAALTVTHGVAGAIVGTSDTQTLTNKTLNSSVIGNANTESTTNIEFISGGDKFLVAIETTGIIHNFLWNDLLNDMSTYFNLLYVALLGNQTIEGEKVFTEKLKIGGSGTSTERDLIVDPANKMTYIGRVSPTGGDSSGLTLRDRLGGVYFKFDPAVLSSLIMAEPAGASVGIGISPPTGKLHVDQSSTTAAIPTLILDQADLSEEMIEFDTTVGAGNPIDTAALGTYYGKVRVSVNGTFKFLALYNS